MEQIIYLEVDDDILTVRDRLQRVQAKHVLLVVPAACKALQRSLDLRLLRRQAAGLGLDLALISSSAALRDLAVEEGIPVFTRLSLGRKVTRERVQWRQEDLPGLMGLLARLRRQRPRWWHWVLGPATLTVVLATLIGSALAILPSATVQVVPAREPIGASIWIEADPSARMVDWDRQRMPSRVVQIEVVDRGEVETTGVTNVAAAPAGGSVMFVNSTQREFTIPVDTIVSTTAGTLVRFRTTAPATIGPRGRVQVSIQALEPGPGGNVRANMINRVEGPLAIGLGVTNPVGTGGGTSQQVRRVTHGDKQRVSDLLITKLIQKGHAELSSQLEDEFMPIEAMWINNDSIRTNFDQHVDDQSDTLALEMRAIVGGLTVSEETAQEIARRALSRQVRQGFHLLPETVHVARGDPVEVDSQTGIVRFVMDGVGLMEADIDVSMLREAIRGRPAEEALAYMRQVLPTEVEPSLAMNPDWMTRLPWLTFRILVIEEDRPAEVVRALPGP